MAEPRDSDAPQRLDSILQSAITALASDVHFEPVASGYLVRRRTDGLLQDEQTLDAAAGRALVNRLMVLAGLLSYRLDVPQEGRFAQPVRGSDRTTDIRLAVIPTIHGLRAVVRLPGEMVAPGSLEELNLHPDVLEQLKRFAAGDFGMVLCCGPAGSGKTTTLYALLRHMAQTAPHQSIITLEDPVERAISGVTQIEVSPFGQLTYEKALRSILRQDPQVLMLGEIRDSQTASLAMQAALTGHRLLCTLHAPSPQGAIARLIEMGIEPYQVVSAVWGVLSMRLVRRTAGERYSGRVPVTQWVRLQGSLRDAILRKAGPDELATAISQQDDYLSQQQSARWLVEQRLTDAAELHRNGI
jgi:type II secretory ATPase GspE/PulE/Tfp pilus assembly ATPase PilB-like protein